AARPRGGPGSPRRGSMAPRRRGEGPGGGATDAPVRAPRMPSARARTRIPRLARARADLRDLRCADNLRCAPPAGSLVDVPCHNELRLFIGEGPLFGDVDIGSSKREKVLIYRPREMTFGLIGSSFPALA